MECDENSLEDGKSQIDEGDPGLVSKAFAALTWTIHSLGKGPSHRRQAEHCLVDPSCPLYTPAPLNDQWPASGSVRPSPKSLIIKPEDMRG